MMNGTGARQVRSTPMPHLLISRRGLLRVGAGALGAGAALPLWRGGALLAAQDEPQPGGELIYGLSSDPPNLDPHINSGTAARSVKLMVYNNLARQWVSGNVEPDLAERWEISPDGLEYAFYLRQGVTFHDGAPLTANDVKASIERVQADATGAGRQAEMQRIQEIVVEGDHVVRFRLAQPMASLLENLALPETAILSKAFLDGGGDPNTTMMGTGPFKFESREPGVRTELVRNESYFRSGFPYLDRLIYIPYPDENTRVSALLGGEIDIADYVPWKDMQAIEDDPNLRLALGPESAFMCVVYNVKQPPFDDPRVRVALSYAYDRQAIVDAVFFGRGRAMTGGVIPETSWAYAADLEDTYTYDPERAKQLLAEAGFADGFSATLLSTSQYGMHQSSGEIAQKNLQDIGIDCKLELYDWSTVVQRQAEGNFQFRIHGLAPDLVDPDFMTNFYASGSPFSRQDGFSDPEIDKLLDQGRAMVDQAQRVPVYAEVERRVLELAPWSYLAWREQGEGLKEEIQGYEHLPGSVGFLSAITLEQTWRKS